VFEMPWAISSRFTSRLSSLTAAPRAGTLMGTCMMPKNERANMVGIVLTKAAPSMLPNSVMLSVSVTRNALLGLTEVRIEPVEVDASLWLLEDPPSVADHLQVHAEDALDDGVKRSKDQNKEHG
jgi:hypothetical protein